MKTDWSVGLKVNQPTFKEPPEMQEARVLRLLDTWIMVNSDKIDRKTVSKLQKTVNTRLLNIMDEVRDAEAAE